MNKLKILGAAVALIGASATVSAAPITLAGYGPLSIDFTNREQISVTGSIPVPGSADTESNWGIATINTIRQADITTPNTTLEANLIVDPIFTAGASAQITAIFYGITLVDFSGNTLKSGGGFLDLYWDEPGLVGGGTLVNINTVLPGARTAADQFTGVTDGIFLTRFEFASGIDASDSDVTISGSSDGFPGNVAGTSSAEGYLNQVCGATNYSGATGAWDCFFDTDWFQFDPVSGLPLAFGSRDLRFRNTFSNNNNWAGGTPENPIFGANSSDPVDAFRVPEPGLLSLLGAGLIAFGFARRRRV